MLKAVTLFRSKTKLKFHAKFFLDKKIPIEAGLGGGSSNAATTLWALNELTQYGASKKILQSWGGEIGADVAFFFSEGAAFCTGVGDQVNDHAPLPLKSFWIAKPKGGLSTPLVFKVCNPNPHSIDPLHLLSSFQLERPQFINDLEEPAILLRPELKQVKSNLQDLGFDQVMMTGSGTAFLCAGK
ncbi:MAG: 4-(cytidine 5'-diphospho)-2-C-methyl-D-erythritol kinase, partial [Simkaniaceae bacterium]|nr:4-(cytidine 5'-diphospho)-2-C-methyl-D-erythritol kinase [Simkaniaceae bacterium]